MIESPDPIYVATFECEDCGREEEVRSADKIDRISWKYCPNNCSGGWDRTGEWTEEK